MADLDPITAEDLEALRFALEAVDRAAFESIDGADLLTVAGADAAAVVAAANAVFGLLDLLAGREAENGHLTARLAEGRRRPRVQQQANGDQLWGAR